MTPWKVEFTDSALADLDNKWILELTFDHANADLLGSSQKRQAPSGPRNRSRFSRKLARACYYVMRVQVPFQAERLLG